MAGRAGRLGAALAVLLFGCLRSPGGLEAGPGRLLADASAVRPDRLAAEEIEFRIGDTAIPARLVRKEEGDTVRFEILAADERVEEEVYRVSAREFALRAAAGETFEPPVPLLRFPFRIGDRWSWQGTIESGGRRREASAAIETAGEKLELSTGSFETLRVRVDFAMPSGGPEPARRTSLFWFDLKEGGSVKRSFGFGSAREPRSPSAGP